MAEMKTIEQLRAAAVLLRDEAAGIKKRIHALGTEKGALEKRLSEIEGDRFYRRGGELNAVTSELAIAEEEDGKPTFEGKNWHKETVTFVVLAAGEKFAHVRQARCGGRRDRIPIADLPPGVLKSIAAWKRDCERRSKSER